MGPLERLWHDKRSLWLLWTIPGPLLNGNRLETWRLLKIRFDLVVSFPPAHAFVGTRFTRWATHGTRMDQSWLDRFYLSDNGFWIQAILRLKHVQTQMLSNHDPILLTIQIAPHHSIQRRKTSYFKANPRFLKKQGTIEALWAAEVTHPTRSPTLPGNLTWLGAIFEPPIKQFTNSPQHQIRI